MRDVLKAQCVKLNPSWSLFGEYVGITLMVWVYLLTSTFVPYWVIALKGATVEKGMVVPLQDFWFYTLGWAIHISILIKN